MSRIAKQDQRVAKAHTGVAPTSRRASARGGSASDRGAYPPPSADPPPPGRARPRFCLPPCCDFSAPLMMAEARENEIGAEIRAGGSQGAGSPAPWLRAAGILAAAVLSGLAGQFVGRALAHSWYPYECCSDRDCYAVPKERVRVVPGGWMLDGFFVGYGEARPSPDGLFHICRTQDGKGDLIRPTQKPACAWAPVQGS